MKTIVIIGWIVFSLFLFVFSLKNVKKSEVLLEKDIKEDMKDKAEEKIIQEISDIEKAEDKQRDIIILQYILWLIFTVLIGFFIY